MNRDDLVLDNLNLIYFVIKQMGLCDYNEYYYDVGLIALIQAAKHFDETKGYTFSTFATAAIRNEFCKDAKMRNRYKRRSNFNTISLDIPIGEEDDDGTLMDLIPSDVNVEQEVIDKIQREEVREAIKSILTNKEKEILKYYLGQDLTQKEVAAKLGHSQAYISRRLQMIADKLKRYLKNGRRKKWM